MLNLILNKNTKSNKLKIICLCLISLLISIMLCELILRFFSIGYGSAPLDGSKIFHHEHPKNYSFLSYFPNGEYGGFNVTFDKMGNRISKNFTQYNSNRRIAFLGDSFTEALQVSYDDSFVGLIGNKNKIDVYNFGVSSYSPLIYLAQIKEGLNKLKPTDLIIQIFENDLTDDKFYYKNADNKNLKLFTKVSGENRFFLIKILRYSYFARLIRRSQLQLKYILYDIGFFQKPANNALKPKKFDGELTLNIIKQIKQELKKTDINLYLITIPKKELTKKEKCCKKDFFYNYIKEFTETNDIVFIDTAKSFQNHPNQSKLFFDIDIHLTEEGHKLIASDITKKMQLKFVKK